MEENVIIGNEADQELCVYSKTVKAGRRTYSFSLKRSPVQEQYVSIIETKMLVDEKGRSYCKKYDIIVDLEDIDGLYNYVKTTIGFIIRHTIRTNYKAALMDVMYETHLGFVSVYASRRLWEITENVEYLLRCLGFQRETQYNTVALSTIRAFKVILDASKTKEEVNAIYDDTKKALDDAFAGRLPLSETDDLSMAVANIINSLKKVDEAVIMLGKILIVKGTNEERSGIIVERCSPKLMFQLRREPIMLSNASLMFGIMSEEQKRFHHEASSTVIKDEMKHEPHNIW